MGMAPMEARFVYRGCIHTGFYEYDSRLVLMDLRTAQAFLNRGDAVRWLEIRVKDMFNTQMYARAIQGALHVFGTPDLVNAATDMKREIYRDWTAMVEKQGRPENLPDLVNMVGNIQRDLRFSGMGDVDYSPYRVLDWRDLNANLFQALKLQKSIMVLFFLVIVIVAAFNVVGTQMMILREKAREIAIMNTVGAGGRGVFKVFFWHGLILGGLGSALGLGLGAGIIWAIGKYEFALDPSVYMINTLPARMDLWDAAGIAGLTLVVLTATCTISAFKASKADPVQGLRRVV
jgi:lipoprotein-releasing system permease protein